MRKYLKFQQRTQRKWLSQLSCNCIFVPQPRCHPFLCVSAFCATRFVTRRHTARTSLFYVVLLCSSDHHRDKHTAHGPDSDATKLENIMSVIMSRYLADFSEIGNHAAIELWFAHTHQAFSDMSLTPPSSFCVVSELRSPMIDGSSAFPRDMLCHLFQNMRSHDLLFPGGAEDPKVP